MSFQSLNLTGLSCSEKVKDLLVRGATRGRTEDLRSAHGRGRSDKELKRWLEWKMLWNLPETAVQFPWQLVERGGVGSGKDAATAWNTREPGVFLLGRKNKPAKEKKMCNQNLDFSSHFHFSSQCLHTVRLVVGLGTGKLDCQHWLQDLSSLSLAALG